jgi:LPS-assembly lipoprotein
MEVTYLEAGNPHSDLALTLERRLRASGVRLTDNRQEATAVLRLLRDESGQRLLSISAENLPQEYEVYYTVSYQLLADGRPRLTASPITVTRDYSYDETEVLGKLREEELIREALAADLVRLMMRRLATVE